MKVVDMFGCGLPVCALDFAWFVSSLYAMVTVEEKTDVNRDSLDELVQDGVNGRTFKTSSELSQHLIVRSLLPRLLHASDSYDLRMNRHCSVPFPTLRNWTS